MSISEKDVQKIARLARLKLEAEEISRFSGQLGKILDSFRELNQVDTSSVAATSHVLGLTDVLRPDEARPFGRREDLLANAPQREGPYFKVPKVIE